MSCNPAIGGLGKGQLVREVDALGGAMGRVADATGIQFRMLNTGKGAAVRRLGASPTGTGTGRRPRPRSRPRPGWSWSRAALPVCCSRVPAPLHRVLGVRLEDGRELRAGAVVMTTGTFLQAVMHTGSSRPPEDASASAPRMASPGTSPRWVSSSAA